MSDSTFIKLSNFRDLGGIQTKDGKYIKAKKLLRSGQLFELPQNEIEHLENVYNLKTIVDLRRPAEAEESPNVSIAGSNNYLLNISGEGKFSTSNEDFVRYLETVSADESLLRSYDNFVESENAKYQYRQFFDLLLDHEEGSFLWHCFAGKDRTGIAAFYLLSALGVEDDIIMEDYMLTNELRERENQGRLAELRQEGVKEETVLNMYDMLRVKPLYLEHAMQRIDSAYPSRLDFLETEIGLDAEKIQRLKDKFLTD